MRKVILMVLLAVVSNSAIAEWVAVGNDTNRSYTAYIDFSTIRINGDKVKMWELRDFNSAQESSGGKPYLSLMVQIEYDCKEEQVRDLYFSEHSGNMREGEVVNSSSKHSKWQPVSPESIGEAMWKVACGKQ